MSSTEPEYQKWLEYTINLHKERFESLDDGYEPVLPEDDLPEVLEEWNTSGESLQEIDAINLRLQRDLVYAFQNQLEIKRRARFPGSAFQSSRAMSRWAEVFYEELVDEHVNRKLE